MKHIKQIFCLFLVLVLLSGTVSAFAEGETVSDPRFDGKSWDEVISDFLSAHDAAASNVGIGYVNLSTGEECYVNADEFRVTASMYKVPMNMIFGKKISAGEMSMDEYISGYIYRDLLRSTIVYSSNDAAEVLWNKLGGYQKYRRALAPIMGEDPNTVDSMFYLNNYFTPREMIYCLSELYNNQDQYPGIIDCMLEAEPNNYFRASENRYTIAHKYGYVAEDGHYYLNDCAIVWTDDPIAIVIFTDNCSKPYAILSDFITLMIDYTEYQYKARLAAEAAEQARLEAEEQARREALAAAEAEAALQRAEEQAAQAAATLDASGFDANSSSAAAAAASGQFMEYVLYILVIVAFLIGLVEVLQHQGKILVPWGALAALAAALALCVCIYGSTHGTVILQVDGDPDETVTAFFADLQQGDYDGACAYLSDTATLGFASASEGDAALLRSALIESYSYQLYGDPVQSGLNARRAVLFTYLDLNALSAAVEENVELLLPEVVEGLTREQTYDENGSYLPSVTETVYSRALAAALEHADRYYTITGLVLNLSNAGGVWYLSTDSSLLTAISGGLM